jgi:hypothetical protein
MPEKIVVVIMGQNCEKFIKMCLESIKDADAIVYCDGGSTDFTLGIANSHRVTNNIYKEYNQDDPTMNGKQRNFYLDYVKKKYPDFWCLVLDADEVVDDFFKIKDFIQGATPGLYSVKMEHFIGDLGHLDATQENHWVPNRLFKINEADGYPEVEHPTLQGTLKESESVYRNYFATDCTTIWHLAGCPNLWEFKKRYEKNLKHSNIHSKEFLDQWYKAHLFGTYPIRGLNYINIPGIILKEFGINPDEIYFMTHNKIEIKHFIMMKQWIDKFNPKNILDLGAGLGLYGYVANYLEKDYLGIEKSEYAVQNACAKIIQGDITKGIAIPDSFDLILVLDVLEHLSYDELDFALRIISKLGKDYIFSLPYLEDPNLNADPTHKIKETKEWWINKLSQYFKIEDAPKEWLFNHQLLIGKI